MNLERPVVSLPTSTLTFLFTDIEGSTQRWEADRSAMAAALIRHDTLLTQTIAARGGRIFKTMGDSVFSAFSDPQAALTAAVDAQRALQAEDWSEVDGLPVRMALHTGVVQEQDADYVGPPVNRVARLLEAGHGGQILLSEVTWGLIRDNLTRGIRMHDLGEHRLKDLYRPERIYQVVVNDLPSEFPPLRTLASRPNNLPLQPTPFIGREQPIHAVIELLTQPGCRVVTLVGPGGTGKTRLALQVGAELLEHYPDGVWFVGLADVSDSSLVLPTIASTLGVQERSGQPLFDTLVACLVDKRQLLIFDNLEQVIDSAGTVAQLLRRTAGLSILVTSRVPLRIQGEHEYWVSPLALPDPKQLPDIDRLSQYEAIQLFIERAQGVKPDFQITNENAPAIAEICVRLDGLPLALELAAVRLKLLNPEAMLRRLAQRLPLLTGGARDLPLRQQTLRNAIAWSYELLTEDERKLYRRLSVFRGGWTLEAAEAVAGSLTSDEVDIDVFHGLSSLIDHSMVRSGEAQDEGRFSMLETIREYALDQLIATGEAESARFCHAQVFLQLVEEAEPHLRGPDQACWLGLLDAEIDNLREALAWTIQHRPEIADRMNYALAGFWESRSISEGREWAEQIVDACRGISIEVQARSLISAGFYSFLSGNIDAAHDHARLLLPLVDQLDERSELVAEVYYLHSTLESVQLNVERAEAYSHNAISIYQHLGRMDRLSGVLNNLSVAYDNLGKYERAVELLEQALAIDLDRGDLFGASVERGNLAFCMLNLGEVQRAADLFQNAIPTLHDFGAPHLLAENLQGVAQVALAAGVPDRATRILAAAKRLQAEKDLQPDPLQSALWNRAISATRAALSASEWSSNWSRGESLSIEQAIAEALGVTKEFGSSSSTAVTD